MLHALLPLISVFNFDAVAEGDPHDWTDISKAVDQEHAAEFFSSILNDSGWHNWSLISTVPATI